jgi:hypothetical protein
LKKGVDLGRWCLYAISTMTPADYLKLLKVNPAPWMLRVKVRSSDIGA